MARADIVKDLLAHLTATVSLLEDAQRNGKKPSMSCPSDKMYHQMIKDYNACIGRGRAYLKEIEDA